MRKSVVSGIIRLLATIGIAALAVIAASNTPG